MNLLLSFATWALHRHHNIACVRHHWISGALFYHPQSTARRREIKGRVDYGRKSFIRPLLLPSSEALTPRGSGRTL